MTLSGPDPRRFSTGILPNGRLKHLVLAATDHQNAETHWERYVHETRYTFPNEGEFRLFPLIAWHLGPNPEVSAKVWLSENTKWAEARTEQILAAQGDLESLLHHHGCRLLWTKGTALSQLVYPHPALRPSSDLDAICAWDDLQALSEIATAHAWRAKLGQVALAKGQRYSGNEISWVIPSGIELDVCWMPRQTFAYDPFLVDMILAQAAKQPGFTSYADPSWLLIEAIDHGLSANLVSPIRWVVDGVRLVDELGASIDWDMVLEVGNRYRTTAMLHFGLSTIAGFTPNVPEGVLEEMARHKRHPLEIDEVHARAQVVDLGEAYRTARRYNLLLRAPHNIYRRSAPSPLAKGPGQTLHLRVAIAAKNLYSRLLWPLRKLVPWVRHGPDKSAHAG